ncbi:PucR family transcriptional regulator [Peribacillus acanthi]|uniref:PucR family transcriptional regulator n=1 Tax=Peribacillus acanthi TaxID=2171554 RepID=UPI00130034DD|nr:helix-turn-helix domain-containing protein [Peribacillus acanthi]
MIENLKQRYPRSIDWNENVLNYEKYLWIEVSEDSTLGIPYEDLTEQETSLLSVLFKIHEPTKNLPLHSLKKEWMDYLKGKSVVTPITNHKNMLVIQFFVFSSSFNKDELEEGISSFLDFEPYILWESLQKGCFILFEKEETILSLLQEMISTIEADFYIKLQMYVGKFHPIDNSIPLLYKYEQTCFEIGSKFLNNKSLISLVDVFPYLILQGIGTELVDYLINDLLDETIIDHELIKTIKTYIESNSNASLAAKKLFIHRNSLQYRIDKFIEKTGLDIKSFQDAMVAYLAIILFEKFD